jgi:hypothetical protein
VLLMKSASASVRPCDKTAYPSFKRYFSTWSRYPADLPPILYARATSSLQAFR